MESRSGRIRVRTQLGAEFQARVSQTEGRRRERAAQREERAVEDNLIMGYAPLPLVGIDDVFSMDVLLGVVRDAPVRTIHKANKEAFLKLSGRLLATLSVVGKAEEGVFSSDTLDKLVKAFLFFPSVLMNGSKNRSEKACATILYFLSDAADPLKEILILRNKAIERDQAKPKKKQGRGRKQGDMLSKRDIDKIEALVRFGNLGKAMAWMEREGVCEPPIDVDGNVTHETQLLFNSLFPQSVADEEEFDGDENGIFRKPVRCEESEATGELIVGLSHRFKRLSSTGMISWSYELIYLLCNTKGVGEDIGSLAPLIAELVNNLKAGKLGPAIGWLNTLLVFIPKAGGGQRAICIDNVWVRLSGKCVVATLQADTAESVKPFQMGVGLKGGSQVLAHTVANWAQDITKEGSDKIIAKTDMVKAYNFVSRREMRKAIVKLKPEWLDSYDYEYGVATPLYLPDGKYIGDCAVGIRTGDVKGPALFALVLHLRLLKLKEQYPSVQVASLIDDTTLYGSPEIVLAALATFKELLKTMGVSLHGDTLGKNKIFQGRHKPQLRTDISVTSEGMEIVGCPVGSRAFTVQFVDRKVDKWRLAWSRLKGLSPNYALPLMKFCVYARIGYVARVAKPYFALPCYERFDKLVIDSVENILIGGVNISGTVGELIMQLPWGEAEGLGGGLGLPKLVELGPRAYAASYYQAHNLIAGDGTMRSLWEDAFGEGLEWAAESSFSRYLRTVQAGFKFGSTTSSDQVPKQKDLMTDFYKLTNKTIQERLRSQPALLAQFYSQQSGGSSWMSSAFNGHGISSKAMTYAVKSRLLCQIFFTGGMTGQRCECRHSRRPNRRSGTIPKIVLDDAKQVYHALSCPEYNGRFKERHDRLYEIFMKLVTENIVGAEVSKEVFVYAEQDRAVMKKADVMIRFPDQEVFYIDFAICNSAGGLYSKSSLETVLKDREDAKRKLYVPTLGSGSRMNYFVPFIMDQSCNFGKQAINFLQRLQSYSENKHLTKWIKTALEIYMVEWNSEFVPVYNAQVDMSVGPAG